MDTTKRIIINTIAQYAKAIINICLSLYSTRLVLDALSIPDYGIYSVVGGIVAMLGFITNALVITTQRYLSISYGQGNEDETKSYFANSLALHIGFGLVLVVVLMLFKDFVVYDLLNVSTQRLDATDNVYVITTLMLFITILTAPYKALFIARENIVYISVVEILDGVMKLLLALGLSSVSSDRLVVYSIFSGLILSFNLLAFAIYALLKYKECCICITPSKISPSIISKMMGFAGWMTFGMGAVASRNQGTAVVINHFMGTVANAAYGIAFQIYAALSFVSSSILNAMNPQIIKAEGSGDRKKMLKLAFSESKFSTALMGVVSVPIMFEMDNILALWLKEVPQHTGMFCNFVLLSFLCDQLTSGLNTVNQALGRIRNYTLLVYTPKLMSLPLFFLILYYEGTLALMMWTFVIIELLVSLSRIPYTASRAGMYALQYFKEVVSPLIPLFSILSICGFLSNGLIDGFLGVLFTIGISVSIGIMTIYAFTLSQEERDFIKIKLCSKTKGNVR